MNRMRNYSGNAPRSSGNRSITPASFGIVNGPARYPLATFQYLGHGGNGVVFKAYSTSLGRDVAIKFTLAVHDREALRLRREYTQLRVLDHPRIVRVLDADYNFEPPYFVMEYLEGESLHKLIRRHDGNRLPVSAAVYIAAQIAEGLAYIHSQGLVHRDLKSDNVMVLNVDSADGWALKLMDFGLVRTHMAELQLTQVGQDLGTAHYMAPEQFEDAIHVDARTDLYALGVILYEALTGDYPFSGDNRTQLYLQHRD